MAEKRTTRSSRSQKQGTILEHLSPAISSNTVSTDNTCTDDNTQPNVNTASTDTCTRTDDNFVMAENSINQECNVSNAELKQLILRMESSLTKRIDLLQEELTGIKELVHTNQEDINDLKESVDTNAADIDDIVKEIIPEVNKTCEDLDKKIEKELLKKDLNDRKMNLIFHGLDQQPSNETPSMLVDTLRRALEQDFLCPKDMIRSTYFVNIHRLTRKREDQGPDLREHPRNQKPDPVLVRFGSLMDKDYILAQQRRRPFNKNRTPVMAYPDLPPTMNSERGKLLEHAKSLRQDGKATRIRIVGLDVLLEYRARNSRSGDWCRYKPDEH